MPRRPYGQGGLSNDLTAEQWAQVDADRAREDARRKADEAAIRAQGLTPRWEEGDISSPVHGRMVGVGPDPALPPGTRTIAGGDRSGTKGFWVTGADGVPRFAPEVINGVRVTPTQAAAYALGEGKVHQSVVVKTPDGKMVNYATGLDALPNLFNQKTGRYEVISWADHARLFGPDPPNAQSIAPPGARATPGTGGTPPSGQGTGGGAPAGPPARSDVRGSGVTIGDFVDYTAAARQALHSLGVVNADPYVNDALIDRLAISKANTAAITETFRAMPSAAIQGITLGQEQDYRQVAQSTLSSLGVMRDVTPDEIRRFAQGRVDPEGVHQAFAASPEVLAINPGARYGLSRDQYQRDRGEIERSASSIFDLPVTGTGAESEPAYLREALEERMAPAEVEAGLEDVQRRLGTPPTAEDVRRIRTRPKVKTEEDRAGPAGRRTLVGPTVGVEAPPPNYVGPRR